MKNSKTILKHNYSLHLFLILIIIINFSYSTKFQINKINNKIKKIDKIKSSMQLNMEKNKITNQNNKQAYNPISSFRNIFKTSPTYAIAEDINQEQQIVENFNNNKSKFSSTEKKDFYYLGIKKINSNCELQFYENTCNKFSVECKWCHGKKKCYNTQINNKYSEFITDDKNNIEKRINKSEFQVFCSEEDIFGENYMRNKQKKEFEGKFSLENMIKNNSRIIREKFGDFDLDVIVT
jgi:hypothetical protein